MYLKRIIVDKGDKGGRILGAIAIAVISYPNTSCDYQVNPGTLVPVASSLGHPLRTDARATEILHRVLNHLLELRAREFQPF